jgi:hypothetical protein
MNAGGIEDAFQALWDRECYFFPRICLGGMVVLSCRVVFGETVHPESVDLPIKSIPKISGLLNCHQRLLGFWQEVGLNERLLAI